MLLHLPIVILATLSPNAVSDTVPKFDIARECRFEGGATADFEKCTQDEAAALQELRTKWSQFTKADTKSCTIEATIGGFDSYVELQTCLEMESFLHGRSQFQPTEPVQPGMRLGDVPDPGYPEANAKASARAAAAFGTIARHAQAGSRSTNAGPSPWNDPAFRIDDVDLGRSYS